MFKSKEQTQDRRRGRQTVCYHHGPPPLLPASRHADHALLQDANGSPGSPGQGSVGSIDELSGTSKMASRPQVCAVRLTVAMLNMSFYRVALLMTSLISPPTRPKRSV